MYRRWPPVLALALFIAPVARAQTLYAGFGGGPTHVPGEGGGNRNWSGMVGYQSRSAFGARLSGVETAHRLWLSSELTYQLNSVGRPVRVYALAGPGYVVDFSEGDALLTAGAGLRVQAHRHLFFFGEMRLLTVLGSPRNGPGTIAPITLGVGIGR